MTDLTPNPDSGRDAAPGLVPDSNADAKAGKLMRISGPSRDDDWEKLAADAVNRSFDEAPVARPRLSAYAAIVGLAAIVGAASGALATSGLMSSPRPDPAAALAGTVAKLEADLAALKSTTDHGFKTIQTQAARAGERFDKIEKAQAEPAARLARLNDTVEKLKTAAAAPAPAPVPAAPAVVAAAPVPRDVTGSITPPPPAPKPEVARLPTVEGWVLRDVADGAAVIEGRQGIFEVFPGDPVPGIGRVDAIRRQDGRWVVVTAKGLIVAR